MLYTRSRTVKQDTGIEIRDTSNYSITVTEADHGNPFYFTIKITNDTPAHDYPLEVILRMSSSIANREIFDESALVTTTAADMVILSPETGTGTGQTVISRTVPLLRGWPCSDSLFVILKAGTSPTTGSCNVEVVAHY